VSYDRDADVLYLHVGDPASAADFDESPEGHALRFDRDGRLFGVTIVNAKWTLEQEGTITITIPERVELGPEALAEALAPA
jgi:uncharacterized protein YuzE